MIDPSAAWNEVNATKVSSQELIQIMTGYSNLGMTLFVGTDSMLYNKYCNFSCIVAVHSNELNIANYYFQKQKIINDRFKILENKILKEIQISINTAGFLKKEIPGADIEVHIDIGDTNKNATRYLVETAKGWVKGMGFEVKIKPNSWASSVADWHTK